MDLPKGNLPSTEKVLIRAVSLEMSVLVVVSSLTVLVSSRFHVVAQHHFWEQEHGISSICAICCRNVSWLKICNGQVAIAIDRVHRMFYQRVGVFISGLIRKPLSKFDSLSILEAFHCQSVIDPQKEYVWIGWLFIVSKIMAQFIF